MTTTLLLVRHAQSTNRALRSQIWKEVECDRERFDVELARRSDPDPGLSDVGVEEAKLLAQGYAPVLLDFDEEALIVTSPLRCAIETALPLVRRTFTPPERFVCHAELFDIGSNIYRNEKPSELAARIEADYMLTCRELPSDADCLELPDKESAEQANERVERACAWIDSQIETGEYPVVIMILPAKLLSRCLRRWMRIAPDHDLSFMHTHTGVTTLEWVVDGELTIAAVNDHSHLMDPLDDARGDDVEGLLRALLGLNS